MKAYNCNIDAEYIEMWQKYYEEHPEELLRAQKDAAQAKEFMKRLQESYDRQD